MGRPWLGEMLDDVLHFWRSVRSDKEIDVLLLADVNVCEQAVQKGRRCCCIHAHEERCNAVGECKDHEKWTDWGVKFLVDFRVEVDDAVSDEDVG